MNVRRYEQVGDFMDQAGPFLLAREAENILLLGICGNIQQGEGNFTRPPYFVTVEDGGQVIGAAIRTPPFLLVLASMSPEALPPLAKDALDLFGALPGVNGQAALSKAFAEEWRGLTGQGYRLRMSMRTFRLEKVRPVVGVPGALRRAEQVDREMLIDWMTDFNVLALGEGDRAQAETTVDMNLKDGPRGLFVWEDGGPVAMAGFSGPTPNGIRVVAVYTPPQFRRRGYASACTAALSQHLLDEGRKFCFLFTDLANPTTNHIYQEIGYEPVCDVTEFLFG